MQIPAALIHAKKVCILPLSSGCEQTKNVPGQLLWIPRNKRWQGGGRELLNANQQMGFQSEAWFVFIINYNLRNLKQFLFAAVRHKDCSYGMWIVFSTIHHYGRYLFIAEDALDPGPVSHIKFRRMDQCVDMYGTTFLVGLSTLFCFFFFGGGLWFGLVFDSAFQYRYLINYYNSANPINWSLDAISYIKSLRCTPYNIKSMAEAFRILVWCYWDELGALFSKSYFSVTVLQVSPTLAWSWKTSLTVQPLVPGAGSCREPAALHRSRVSILPAALYHKSVPATQAKQSALLLYYIMLHYTPHHNMERWAIQC